MLHACCTHAARLQTILLRPPRRTLHRRHYSAALYTAAITLQFITLALYTDACVTSLTASRLTEPASPARSLLPPSTTRPCRRRKGPRLRTGMAGPRCTNSESTAAVHANIHQSCQCISTGMVYCASVNIISNRGLHDRCLELLQIL